MAALMMPREMDRELMPLLQRHQAKPERNPRMLASAVAVRCITLGWPLPSGRYWILKRAPLEVRDLVEDRLVWRAIVRDARALKDRRENPELHLRKALAHLLRDDLPVVAAGEVAWLALEGARRASQTGTRVAASYGRIGVTTGARSQAVRDRMRALREAGVVRAVVKGTGHAHIWAVMAAPRDAWHAAKGSPYIEGLVRRVLDGERTILHALIAAPIAHRERTSDALRVQDVLLLLRDLAGVQATGDARTLRRSRARLRAHGVVDESTLVDAVNELSTARGADGLLPAERRDVLTAEVEATAAARWASWETEAQVRERVRANVEAFVTAKGRPRRDVTALRRWEATAAAAFTDVPEASASALRSELRRLLARFTARDVAAAIAERIVPKAAVSDRPAHNHIETTEEAA